MQHDLAVNRDFTRRAVPGDDIISGQKARNRSIRDTRMARESPLKFRWNIITSTEQKMKSLKNEKRCSEVLQNLFLLAQLSLLERYLELCKVPEVSRSLLFSF